MPFYPSIQALIGPHTPSDFQCAVDWQRNNVFIIGDVFPSFDNYISSVGLLSGVEQAYTLTSALTTPVGGLGIVSGGVPLTVDGNGDLYSTWYGGNGGGLIKMNGSTLVQITSGGTLGAPPYGFISTNGTLSNIPVGTTQFILGSGPGGGSFTYQHEQVVYNQVAFAGRYEDYGFGVTGASKGLSCAGKAGTGIGFVLYGPLSPGDTQAIFINKVSCMAGGSWVIGDWPTQNSLITISALASFVPGAINGAWTQIYPNGICIDQTDGNILLWCSQNDSNPGAIVKVNSTTGAIVWNTAVPPNTGLNQQLSFSSITHQSLAVVTGAVNGTVTTINTATGSSANYTAGLAGLGNNGYQCYNDSLGAIVLQVDFGGGAGSPTRLNSTPATFGGWAVLYVNPAPAPPAGSRRFLAEAGPIRVIQ